MKFIETDPGFPHTIRQLTAPFRRLPDFIIIGTMKGGTSSLYSYMVQHPSIKPSRVKELHYFNRYYHERSLAWYRSFFPLRVGSNWITGEATPAYLYYPGTAQRIHALLPRVRLIVLLRNPTDRAISHYFHMQRQGREDLPVMEALEKEENRLENELLKMKADERYFSTDFGWFSYKSRGKYAQQLKRYRDLFDPSQMLIIKSDDFFTQPNQVLQQAFSFLGLDPGFHCPNLTPSNVGSYNVRISPEVYRYLNNYFADDNAELRELTGISW
jgi:hypothetical protein